MGFDGAVFLNVADLQIAAKMAADENGTVAFEAIFLGAHQREAKFARAFADAFEAGLEGGKFGDAFVAGDALNVNFAFDAAGAEFVAEENVLDVGGAEGGFEGGAVELRSPGAEGVAADVADGFDFVLAQEVEEFFRGVRGMADGKKVRHARRG
jgi:hypothetical protein